MSKKTLEQCRDGKDFERYALAHGGSVVTSGKGIKIYGPNGNSGYAVLHCNHPKELATGTRCALIKALVALGFLLAPIACLISAMVGAG